MTPVKHEFDSEGFGGFFRKNINVSSEIWNRSKVKWPSSKQHLFLHPWFQRRLNCSLWWAAWSNCHWNFHSGRDSEVPWANKILNLNKSLEGKIYRHQNYEVNKSTSQVSLCVNIHTNQRSDCASLFQNHSGQEVMFLYWSCTTYMIERA